MIAALNSIIVYRAQALLGNSICIFLVWYSCKYGNSHSAFDRCPNRSKDKNYQILKHFNFNYLDYIKTEFIPVPYDGNKFFTFKFGFAILILLS